MNQQPSPPDLQGTTTQEPPPQGTSLAHPGPAQNPTDVVTPALAPHLEAQLLPDDGLHGFHNPSDPNILIDREKPVHRLIAYMQAQGMSLTEIATKTGYTIPWLSQVTRQKWFRPIVLREMQEAGRDAVQTMIQGAAVDSVAKIIELRDGSSNQRVQATCAFDLLDRFLGKPVQRSENLNATVDASALKGSQLDEKLAAVEGELKRLGVRTVDVTEAEEVSAEVPSVA